MNVPIGFIGSLNLAKEKIYSLFDESNCVVLEIDYNAGVDEIKEFRKNLNENSIKKKVGIIYFFNKFSETNQSIFLKIFEEMPFFSQIFFHASYDVSFTIQTRSKISYVYDKNTNLLIQKYMKIMLEKMKNKTCDANLMNGYNLFIETLSLYSDGIISEKEKNTILLNLGIKE